jgi:hypothetical protein
MELVDFPGLDGQGRRSRNAGGDYDWIFFSLLFILE